VLTATACVALALAAVAPAEPAMADDAADPTSALVGDFSLGDGLEAMIDERDGALSFTLPAEGLRLGWSSRAAGDDPAGLGAGWGFDLGRVEVDGGVRVRTASGRVFELDRSHESGLAGYGAHDLVFEAVEGRLPVREGGGEPVGFRFALHELGGRSTYFGEGGDPVAEIDAVTGRRTDWSWSSAGRLTGVTSADGVRTELDWQPDRLVIRPAASPARAPAPAPAPTVVRWAEGGIHSITDPSGGHVDLEYAGGLVTRIAGVTGAITEVTWQRFDDAAPRVDRLRTTDGSGTELSARSWSRCGSELPTGWPARDRGGALPDPQASFGTQLSDGRSLVRSSYGALGTLRERRLITSTSSGEREVQAQSFSYPGDAHPGLDPTALPPAWAEPSSATLRSTDARGGVREVTESFEYDEFGRPVVGADGTTYTYDAANRPVSSTTGALTATIDYWPDGTRRSRSTVDAATGAATRVEYFWDDGALLTEVHTGGAGDEPGGEPHGLTSGEAGYLIGLSRLARTTSADDTAYYVADRHGSIAELTDHRGAVIERYAYSDYGAQTRTSGQPATRPSQPITRNPFGFAGELTDPDGTQALGLRSYHPATMRFTSADTADVVSPYAFAGLNPVTKADPSGHMPEWDTIINGVLAGVGAIVLGFTVTTLAAAVPMLGAPATLWTAYGFGWALAAADLFTTAAAVVQVANDFSPRDGRFISDSDSEILTWTSLGVGLATFAGGLVASAFLRETARDAADMLFELDEQNATRHFLFNRLKGTYDERWAVGRTVYVELGWVESPFRYLKPKRRSLTPSTLTQPAVENKRVTLSPAECTEKCNAIIGGISHAGAQLGARNAVTRYKTLRTTPKVPRGASDSVFSNLIENAKGIPGLTPTDLNALDELRKTALTLE
jgi:RHS repeat-associated protein